MAASATNTSRELGAVAGVSILGAIVNSQLTVNLSHRLIALHIPAPIRALVINGVTTGQSASGIPATPQVQALINRVEKPAFAAFKTGLDISLLLAPASCGLRGLALATVRHVGTSIEPEETRRGLLPQMSGRAHGRPDSALLTAIRGRQLSAAPSTAECAGPPADRRLSAPARAASSGFQP